MKNLILILLILISFSSKSIKSQEHHENVAATVHIDNKNDIVGFFGASYIFKSGFVLPTFGLEYIRVINKHICVGAMTEFEVGSHILTYNEDSENEIEVDRESATLVLPIVYFKFGHFSTSFGYGVEFEKSQNLGLMKIGICYTLPLKNDHWYVIPNLSWDHTSEFDALVYGFNVARSF